MVDFFKICVRDSKRGTKEIYPSFILTKSTDLMIRGGDFYAVWLEDQGLWSMDEQDALDLIDSELDKYATEYRQEHPDTSVKVLYIKNAENRVIKSFHTYCKDDMRDSYHELDNNIIFANQKTSKKDYASTKLPYSLEKSDISAYDQIISTLYDPEERRKIEWAIGAIISGDSKKIQKFLVFYGDSGTGKSTIFNIIQLLFEGYYSTFEAKALGSSTNAFALESFKSNPLVAIQHDGDLSRIEDNTKLNSLVSHELMTVNEKFKSQYTAKFRSFLFMGTNKPVRITDAKSGLIRRLIDVRPSGRLLAFNDYIRLTNQATFELGGIAQHCLDVYKENPHIYDNYIPVAMIGASNDFYNFISESYYTFKKDDSVTLKSAWEMYKTYCSDANVPYPMSRRNFQEELKCYFKEFEDRYTTESGERLRSYYIGFKSDIFDNPSKKNYVQHNAKKLMLNCDVSILDKELANQPAQYAEGDHPKNKWSKVKTTLADLDTHKLHYVQSPENYIFVDFDLRDENGNKSLEKNLEAASKWPPTYAELSKSGEGIHLHYIYLGDTSKLANVWGDGIEIKTQKGNSALRRKLTKCNDLPIATLTSGLPLKEDKKMVNTETIKNEVNLRNLIKRNLNKEIHPGTKPSIDFIYHILEEAYESGIDYDISDMHGIILAFAANSTHQADYCIKMVGKMKFCSAEKLEHGATAKDDSDDTIIFYDIEVFPNLFLVNWKAAGEDAKCVRWINPSKEDIETLISKKLIGFNCRRYDNHILYARLMGYDNEQLYSLSKKIVSGDSNCFFKEAYNISYTDVYDFCSKKQSLKKWEVELGITHLELGLPWDQPVPESLWNKVAEYCDNDVISTEAVFNVRQADFTARKILAALANGTVNDTTNSLTTKIIFGNERNPQEEFNYRDMGDESDADRQVMNIDEFTLYYPEYCVFDKKHRPIFPGYKYDTGKSTYRGIEVGEGGYVYAEPGAYTDIDVEDVASMHPHSIIAEMLFGYQYTPRFEELVKTRVLIKHGNFEEARHMLNGKLAPFLTDEGSAKALAQALKIAINSVYGLTAATFSNPFRDMRNKDNIVAKRGALFMINLCAEVQARGFTVAHIKTDSIKIPNATPEIISFVRAYGKLYGYTFETEDVLEKMCLVNDAVYIAKTKDGKWEATGAQFRVPYVFKTLFTHEPIEFADLCETKSVSNGSALYLDMNEMLPENDHNYTFVGRVGSFCPIQKGYNGGVLYREKDGKYYAATGTKGYRWLESEHVKQLHMENYIDKSYYDKLVEEAEKTLSDCGVDSLFYK